ncbi:MAG: hypothetical protein HYZ09_01115 [Candidatus Kerfeldbacteria bacterium]|nr:hypothetical protein [Candidatus Kerfeldbacteria bacterium]
MTNQLLQETGDLPVCEKCHAKHYPHEACKSKVEDAVPICSLCVGNHPTEQCPVLQPGALWEQPEFKRKRRRRRGGRRRDGRRQIRS